MSRVFVYPYLPTFFTVGSCQLFQIGKIIFRKANRRQYEKYISIYLCTPVPNLGTKVRKLFKKCYCDILFRNYGTDLSASATNIPLCATACIITKATDEKHISILFVRRLRHHSAARVVVAEYLKNPIYFPSRRTRRYSWLPSPIFSP